jgi:hypothetical protein
MHQNDSSNDIIRLNYLNKHGTCDVVKKQGPLPLILLTDLHHMMRVTGLVQASPAENSYQNTNRMPARCVIA